MSSFNLGQSAPLSFVCWCGQQPGDGFVPDIWGGVIFAVRRGLNCVVVYVLVGSGRVERMTLVQGKLFSARPANSCREHTQLPVRRVCCEPSCIFDNQDELEMGTKRLWGWWDGEHCSKAAPPGEGGRRFGFSFLTGERSAHGLCTCCCDNHGHCLPSNVLPDHFPAEDQVWSRLEQVGKRAGCWPPAAGSSHPGAQNSSVFEFVKLQKETLGIHYCNQFVEGSARLFYAFTQILWGNWRVCSSGGFVYWVLVIDIITNLLFSIVSFSFNCLFNYLS